jgi:hypothetical protein
MWGSATMEDGKLLTTGKPFVSEDDELRSIMTQALQAESDSIRLLDRIQAVESDPPVATKPKPAPPTIADLLSLLRVIHEGQKCLLGRLVALEQGRKYNCVTDLTHPFED